MINVQQVAVEVNMGVRGDLDSGIGSLVYQSAWREEHPGVEAKGRHRDGGEALGAVLILVHDHLLDLRMGRLAPIRAKRRHECTFSGETGSNNNRWVTYAVQEVNWGVSTGWLSALVLKKLVNSDRDDICDYISQFVGIKLTYIASLPQAGKNRPFK